MDDTLLFDFKAFSGINNIDPSFRLPRNKEEKNSIGIILDLAAAENLDINNAYALETRPGSVLKVSGSDIHSPWSDGKICIFVDGVKLYILNTDFSITEIKTGLTLGARISYQPLNDRIYMTNGSFIGYLHSMSVAGLTDPQIKFKSPLPPGQRITYFQGQLFVASGKVLYISDALCDHYDIRYGLRVFEHDITMLRAVDKGLYVADGNTWFLTKSPAVRLDEPDEFRREKVMDCDAIPYTDIIVNGKDIKDGVPGNYLMWMSTEGVCIGDNSGKIVHATADKYFLPAYGWGGAYLRRKNGVNHYVATLG